MPFFQSLTASEYFAFVARLRSQGSTRSARGLLDHGGFVVGRLAGHRQPQELPVGPVAGEEQDRGHQREEHHGRHQKLRQAHASCPDAAQPAADFMAAP